MGEIEYEARRSKDYEEAIRRYRAFMDVFDQVGYSPEAEVRCGEIRASLEGAGTPIGSNDLLIAATVLAEGGILVTHDVREFGRVEGLRIEDWTA